MSIRASLVCVSVLLVCGSAWSQANRLGEVAGSIKLDSSALTESEGGFVDDPKAAKTADQELLAGVLGDCAAQAKKIADLMVVIQTSWSRVGDDRWIGLEGATVALEDGAQDLFSLRLTGAFRSTLEASLVAADICGAAAKTVRNDAKQPGLLFKEAGPAIAQCRQYLGAAVSLLAEAGSDSGKTPRSASDSGTALEPEAPPTPEEIVAGFCEPKRSRGQAAFDECEDRQLLAFAALESRTPGREAITEQLFAEIRESCRLEHPNGYYQQDLCEQERMTAARIQAETES